MITADLSIEMQEVKHDARHVEGELEEKLSRHGLGLLSALAKPRVQDSNGSSFYLDPRGISGVPVHVLVLKQAMVESFKNVAHECTVNLVTQKGYGALSESKVQFFPPASQDIAYLRFSYLMS